MSRLRLLMGTLAVVLQIAFRNLFASRLKTLIVGGIVFFGALLVVVGTSLVDSVDRAMSRSVIGSVAGHIQVYSALSKDDLQVMNAFSAPEPDLAPLEDFEKVRAAVTSVANVKTVVPMGIGGAVVTSGNSIDIALAKLRTTATTWLSGTRPPELLTSYEGQKAHVRDMITLFQTNFTNARKLRDEKAISEEDGLTLVRSASQGFWNDFDREPLAGLEFLENHVAPLATDGDMLTLRYLGTDPGAFSRTFDRMRIVDGVTIPPGQHGFLFAKYVYEEEFKLKTALRLDKMKEAIEKRGKTIASDLELQRFVKANREQVRELLLQLDLPKTALFRRKIQGELGSAESDVSVLLAELFNMADGNFARRYRFFYDQLAPSLELYRVRVGDNLVIKAYSRSGYLHSVKLRVYGTFSFEGLERSQLAGGLNVMDLGSFRELYGFLTVDRLREIQELKAAAGARDVDRAHAEHDLFVTIDTPPVAVAAPPVTGRPTFLAGPLPRENRQEHAYDPQELERGLVLNAAVILKDPEKLEETRAAIEAAGVRMGLPLRACSWQKAAGLLGQFITVMKAVLYTAVLIIFLVALVIINNALVMATLERISELGTLRAIGAQRRTVFAILLIEALVVGLVFGGLGAGLGMIAVMALGRAGIPAANDVFSFFFSGPSLHPTLGAGNVVGALIIVLLVSVLSGLYPAWLAMRVTPRQAMQTED